MVFHIQINPSGEETLIASLIHLSVYYLSFTCLPPIYLLSIIYLSTYYIYLSSVYIYIYLPVYLSVIRLGHTFMGPGHFHILHKLDGM